MSRLARVVVPGYPYHVTHRGNRRDAIFCTAEDREIYLAMLCQYAARYGMEVWAYCLMTNHVHLIVVPQNPESMANAIGRAHMRYARWHNRQRGWTGHLWANRFYSSVLDEEHLWHAVRYVEANPRSCTHGRTCAGSRVEQLLCPRWLDRAARGPFVRQAVPWKNWRVRMGAVDQRSRSGTRGVSLAAQHIDRAAERKPYVCGRS